MIIQYWIIHTLEKSLVVEFLGSDRLYSYKREDTPSGIYYVDRAVWSSFWSELSLSSFTLPPTWKWGVVANEAWALGGGAGPMRLPVSEGKLAKSQRMGTPCKETAWCNLIFTCAVRLFSNSLLLHCHMHGDVLTQWLRFSHVALENNLMYQMNNTFILKCKNKAKSN